MGTTRYLRLILVLLLTSTGNAGEITPRPEVTTGVILRAEPSVRGARLGVLQPGARLTQTGEAGAWYAVTLPDGRRAYVSKRWTILVRRGFSMHVVDVGTGDAILVRSGTTEIVIDGGESATAFAAYVREHRLITPPIELLVLTHADTDHWRGLPALLGEVRMSVREFWEPGYDRACAPLPAYEAFLETVRSIRGIKYCRPLTRCYPRMPHRVAVAPNITLTILHSDAQPSATPCAYAINSASIVLLLEIDGARVLFTGDATGKLRTERADITPRYVEAQLLASERRRPGLLRADILKAPHHGSETSSTSDFIAAVNPQFVIIPASARHHLPQRSVLERYEQGDRVVLRTNVDRRSGNDHIICTKTETTELECNYEDVLMEMPPV